MRRTAMNEVSIVPDVDGMKEWLGMIAREGDDGRSLWAVAMARAVGVLDWYVEELCRARGWGEESVSVRPCVKCGVEMDADVHEEEMGMCLECSNRFWDHGKDSHACSWECVSMAGMPEGEVR